MQYALLLTGQIRPIWLVSNMRHAECGIRHVECEMRHVECGM